MRNDMETVDIWIWGYGATGCLSAVRHCAADLQDLLDRTQGRQLAQLTLAKIAAGVLGSRLGVGV